MKPPKTAPAKPIAPTPNLPALPNLTGRAPAPSLMPSTRKLTARDLFERVPATFDFSRGADGVRDAMDQDIFDGFSDVIELMGGGPKATVKIRMFGASHTLPRPWSLTWYEALAYWLSVLVTLSDDYFPGQSKDPLKRLLEADGWSYNVARIRTPIDYRQFAEIEPDVFARATSELYIQAKNLHRAGILNLSLTKE